MCVPRLHSAMGAAIAWEPGGRHVASVATDGSVAVVVRTPHAGVPAEYAEAIMTAAVDITFQ